jgi:hypothetical protein
VNIHPTKIRTSFVATDCKWCLKTVAHLRNEFGMPLFAAQEVALKDHVVKHAMTKEIYGESDQEC